MKLAYVAGPYRSQDGPYGILQNIRVAEAVAVELWRMGFAVICPHKNTAMFDGAAPDSVWLKGDIEIMRRCDFVVMVPGWKKSAGAAWEHEIARIAGLPVYEWPSEKPVAAAEAES